MDFLKNLFGNIFNKKEEKTVKSQLVKIENSFDVVEESKKIKDTERVYLVLPGGGACGRWQVGALAWLEQVGLFNSLTGIVGTSVGGLNALTIAKNFNDFNKVINLWEKITKNSDIYEGEIKGGIGGFLGIIGQTFKDNKSQSILKPKGLYETCDREFKGLTLKDFKELDIVTTATDISDIKEDIYTKDNCNLGCEDLAKRTSAIPLAFPVILGANRGHFHVDGGFGNNDPVKTAIQRGATKIIIVATHPISKPTTEIKNNVFSIGGRMPQVAMDLFEQKMWESIVLYQQLAEISEEYKTVEFLKLYPDESTGDALSFDNIEQMQKGYDLAVKYITKEKILKFFEE